MSGSLTKEWRPPGFIARIIRRWGAMLPVLLFLSVLMLYPVGQLLFLSFQTRTGALTLQHYTNLFLSDVYVKVLLITLKISAFTALSAVLVSYPVAYLIATSGTKTKTRLVFWVLLPFWTSFMVRIFAWIMLLGRDGVINQLVQVLGLSEAPLNLLYELGSVVVGMAHALIPLCIFSMVSVMENIDGNLSKAALTLGARRGSTFWRIYFPLSLPGVAAGGILVFITSLGFFVAPALLGSVRETMISQLIIEQVQELLNWSFAGAISLLLLVTALAVFYIYDRLLGLSTLAGEAPGSAKTDRLGSKQGYAARLGMSFCAVMGRLTDAFAIGVEKVMRFSEDRPSFGMARTAHWIFVLLALGFLSLPTLIMVPISFTEGSAVDWPPKGFGFAWYGDFWHSTVWLQAITRSLVVGIGTAILAMAIGTPAGFALARRRIRGKTALLSLLLSPLIVPRIIIAVALFYLYAKVGLVGTYTGLILGHAVLAIPYVVVTIMAVLKNYDQSYDWAAWNLGAGPMQTLARITLPLIKAGLISAFLFAFITSFDELTVALFVTGGLTTTLPKQMWDDAILKVTPTLAVASTMLLIFLTLLIVIAERLQRRHARP